MKARFSPHFLAATIALCANTTQAGIIWDGGGANTNINTAANWNDDVVNALNGSTTAEFGTGGSTATINTNANFSGITINRNANFEIANGSGSLTVGSGGITVTLPNTTARTHTISESNLILGANQTWSVTNNTGAARLNVSSVIDDGDSSFGITKAGTGLLELSGSNSFNGNVTVSAGTLRITNSNGLGTGSKTLISQGGSRIVELSGGITLGSNISLSLSSNSGDNTGLFSSSGSNTIQGNINFTIGNPALNISSAGTSLFTINGSITYTVSDPGTRPLILGGTSTSLNVVNGNISQSGNGAIMSLTKQGAGTWILNGSNSYSGGSSINAGRLLVTRANGLGTGTVTVAANANLSYFAAADVPLTIGGDLAITAGTSTTIGCSIGSSPTSASINVTGNATITDAAHLIDLHGVNGTTPTSGVYTLISAAGAGSALNPSTAPGIGRVFNNSNFTIGALSSTATNVTVEVSPSTPLPNAFWVGGLTGSTNVWSVSNGISQSNWSDAPEGTAQPLVPGETTNVIISSSAPTLAPTATVLGANMSINSLTISDTVNGFGLNNDGYSLRLMSGGVTMESGVPTSTIASHVNLGSNQTWTNHSANPLNVSGIISGSSALTKAGTGSLVLSGANTHTGLVQVSQGTLSLANINALASSTLFRNAADTGVLSYDVVGANTYNLAGLSGNGSLDAGGRTLSIGGTNLSTEFSGSLSNGSLTKLGTGNLTLSGSSSFAGAVTISAGRLTVANSGALGTGPKTVTMQGADRTLYLTNNITLPSNIAFSLSSNSGDGGGLNNQSGDNEIRGAISITTGNPALNISSASGKFTISGNITLVTTARPLIFGGASAADNTVSGNISENSSAVLPVTKQGAGKWIFAGTNTYKGNTNVNAGTLVLASTSSQRFYPLANGTSNRITGTGAGSITLDGALNIDLTNANTASSWNLVDVANVVETYGENFTVTSFTETAAGSGVWTRIVGTDLYTFSESTGTLTRGPIPTDDFSTWANSFTPAIGAKTADDDGDGLSNFSEYAFGLNPQSAASASPMVEQLNKTTGTFKYSRRATPATTNVTYTYESSTTLSGAWTTFVPSTPDVSNGLSPVEDVTVTVPASLLNEPKLFIRVKADQP